MRRLVAEGLGSAVVPLLCLMPPGGEIGNSQGNHQARPKPGVHGAGRHGRRRTSPKQGIPYEVRSLEINTAVILGARLEGRFSDR